MINSESPLIIFVCKRNKTPRKLGSNLEGLLQGLVGFLLLTLTLVFDEEQETEGDELVMEDGVDIAQEETRAFSTNFRDLSSLLLVDRFSLVLDKLLFWGSSVKSSSFNLVKNKLINDSEQNQVYSSWSNQQNFH